MINYKWIMCSHHLNVSNLHQDENNKKDKQGGGAWDLSVSSPRYIFSSFYYTYLLLIIYAYGIVILK